MQRFFTLVALLLCAFPVGISMTGCVTNVSAYCNNAGYGPKTTDILAVNLPALQAETGISLSYGQIGQVGTAQAFNCKGTSLTSGAATYGSSNLQLVDISPTGSICGGTWNRLSAGGIADYTICTPPAGSGTATVTASIGGVVSNPVTVYVHPQVSSIVLQDPGTCYASGQPGQNLFTNTSVFGQDGAVIGTGTGTTTNIVGTITYTANTPAVVNITNTSVNIANGVTTAPGTNGTTTANQPGGTVITATIAGNSSSSPATSSAAGYFYTCPPSSLALTLPSSSTTTTTNGVVNITAGNPQTLTSVLSGTTPEGQSFLVTPTSNAGPDYTSTTPQQVQVTSAGVVSTTLPGLATISGICQPGAPVASTTSTATASSTATGQSCNPTPLNKLGQYGTGLPIVSNPIQVRSPGVNNTLLWAASPNSQRFTPFDLSLSTTGAPTLLPYPPNSMVLDPTGTSLYFGSYRELMTYSALNNTLVSQDITVPGVVLAVSPTNSQVVVADQLRQVIYLYTPAAATTSASGTTSTSNSSVISTGGLANHAIYSPDGKNVYIVGPTTLYVHNIVSGWSQYPIANPDATTSCQLNNTNTDPFCSPDVTLTVPSVAVFVSGNPVIARSFCPDTSVSPAVDYNPLSASVAGDSADHVAATNDGAHIFGANTTTIFDVQHSPTTDAGNVIAPSGACPGVSGTTPGVLAINTTLRQLALTGVTPTQIDQVLASPDSSRAFVTYTAAAATGLLPLYTPSPTLGGTGTLNNLQLAAGAVDPIAGVFSPDSSLFFASTTGDNLIHVVNTTTQTDTEQLNPQLTDSNGAAVPAQFLVSKPRPTT